MFYLPLFSYVSIDIMYHLTLNISSVVCIAQADVTKSNQITYLCASSWALPFLLEAPV
jgi:hypothetical protein